MGASNLDKIPNSPANAQEVVSRGPQTDYTKHCENHCGGHCNACDEYWYHKLTIESNRLLNVIHIAQRDFSLKIFHESTNFILNMRFLIKTDQEL